MNKLNDTLQIHTPGKENTISFYIAGNDEMLKISPDGFYVRGRPVPIDTHEAKTVYDAFLSWLTWQNMQRR
jgi:hypothetical protein